MLRFNTPKGVPFYGIKIFQYILCCGSTKGIVSKEIITEEFQYILCCGSTLKFRPKESLSRYFNTSYVAVQLSFLVFWTWIFGISIHLMLRFNSRWSDLYRFAFKISIHLMLRFNYLFLLQKLIEFPFQYILCCGSTRPSIISKWFQKNFNTSYVAVQLTPNLTWSSPENHFNTSYVAVQRLQSSFLK